MQKTYEEYLKEAGNMHLAYYIEAADILNIDYQVLVRRLLAKFSYQGKVWYIINSATPITNTTSTTIAKRKNLTNLVLSKENIPVPMQKLIDSPIEALKFFNQYKRIVIKPKQQLGGIGITILPNSEKEVIEAYNHAYSKSLSSGEDKVIAEEFIDGENYRLLVVGEKVVGAVRRKSAYIVGDGTSTIIQLIEKKSKDRIQQQLEPIKVDNEVNIRLRELNLTLESIPKNGEEIILRYSCNLSAGGTSEECMQEVDPYYIELAIKSVKATGTEFGGVDIITPDISKPAKCAINEINYNPGLRLHYKVDKGESIHVAIPIMEYIRDKYLNS
jgi:D-alanine-D-alanine ligase-like ATP-grasp enzyme